MLRKVLWALAIGATLLLALAVPEIVNRKAQLAATERQLSSADPIIGNFAPAPIVYKPDVFGSAPKPAPAPTATVQSQVAPVPINRVQVVQEQSCAQWRSGGKKDRLDDPDDQKVYASEPPHGCLNPGEHIYVAGGGCEKGFFWIFSLKSRGDPTATDSAKRHDQFNRNCKCGPGTEFAPMPAAVRDGDRAAQDAHLWCQPKSDKK